MRSVKMPSEHAFEDSQGRYSEGYDEHLKKSPSAMTACLQVAAEKASTDQLSEYFEKSMLGFPPRLHWSHQQTNRKTVVFKFCF